MTVDPQARRGVGYTRVQTRRVNRRALGLGKGLVNVLDERGQDGNRFSHAAERHPLEVVRRRRVTNGVEACELIRAGSVYRNGREPRALYPGFGLVGIDGTRVCDDATHSVKLLRARLGQRPRNATCQRGWRPRMGVPRIGRRGREW